MIGGIGSSSQMMSQLFSRLDSKSQGYIEKSDLASAFSAISGTSGNASETSVDAQRVPAFAPALVNIEALAREQSEAQTEVMAALKAGNHEEAKKLINNKETPAWRKLKQSLLDTLTALKEETRKQQDLLGAPSFPLK